MSSYNYTDSRCLILVANLQNLFDNGQELRKHFSRDDISKMYDYCATVGDEETSDKFSEPMVWIGVYVAIASFFCTLLMAADLLHGFRNKKFWFPCKYFSLDATSITVITVAMKLPVDLTSGMPSYMDQAAKVGSLGFMCVMMANFTPSLASMDNKTLPANVIGLCILVITIIVDMLIQIYTGVIINMGFVAIAWINIIMILLLLIMMISLSLAIPTSKEILESKYQAATKKVSLTDERLQNNQMSIVEKLRQHVRRYWVMAETGNPQFVLVANPISIATCIICEMVMVTNLLMGLVMLWPFLNLKNIGGSTYKWSIPLILLTQFTGVVVGTIAPISRRFSVFMDNKTLPANVIGLCILVITMIVNIFIQINTGVINNVAFERGRYYGFNFVMVAYIYTAMLFLLLVMMISSSLAIPTSKEILESKYQATSKISLTDQRLQHIHTSTVEKLRQNVRRYWVMAETGSPQFVMSIVEKLRHHVRRYWVMAETGNPQFVLVANPISIATSIICEMVMVTNLLLGLVMLWPFLNLRNIGGSTYKWSITLILLTQFTGVVVGTIAPLSRRFSVVRSYKFGIQWQRNFFMFFKVEKYWTQKLHDWKQSTVLYVSSSRRSRGLIYDSKYIILSLCIGFQTTIVMLCKVIWLFLSIPLVNSLHSFASRIEDIDEDLSNYVLQIDNKMELSKKTLKQISNSMNYFILKDAKEENNYLLKLLKKSTRFKGVEIFDSDHVRRLLLVELVNSWSLPIVTLTCIAVALPNIQKSEVEILLRGVGKGLSLARLVEESLNSGREYVNIRKTTTILWFEIEHKRKWLDNLVAKNVFKGKTSSEIVQFLSDKAKEIVTEIKESTTTEDLAENPPHTLIAANSMYRITQTILLRYQNNIELITKKQLFAHLNGMIADIFSACFTNIPRVITMRCHESVIEKREASVKVAARLLGKTTKIIEWLETLEVPPSMDDEKMPYIDKWHLCLKQSIP